ncbi:hypothetical protein HpKG61_05060 [Helicobacter pylori]
MGPFSPLHSQLKSPYKKSAFFKRLSLELGFQLTNIKNAKKDFSSNPPKKRVQKKKGFKRNPLKREFHKGF